MHKCGIRVGVVTIDVPERERGIDFKHENATVAWFSMSIFTTPARIRWFYVKVCNCRRFSIGVVNMDCENHRKPCNCQSFMFKIDATLVFWHIDFHHSRTESMVLHKSVQLSVFLKVALAEGVGGF